MDNIALVTFAAKTVTPQDDALVYESALGAGGIIYGGEVTIKNANTLHINAGHGIICGRKFTIFDSDIPVTLSSSGTLLGRLYIHLDLSNASDPIELLIETGASLSPLVQDDDVNIINGVYDINIATFGVSTSTISDLRNVYPKVDYANSGSLITITTQEASLIGEEVTVTDGTDYVYAVFNADGVAELKNVHMTGTLEVSATNGSDIASATINVPYYGSYTLELAFWGATLYITTPNTELYGQQITITNSSSQVVGTTSFGGSGTATYIVKEPDTYTATVTYGGLDFSASVNVIAQTTYNLTISLRPDGKTVTPTDDISTWLECGGIFDKSYTTLGEVLADSTTLLALISDNNAADYMARSTTWASTIVANSLAMTYIGSNNYCADALLTNSTWRTSICNSTYFESVLNAKVPTMTSNTTPSGEAFSSSVYSAGYQPWKSFDGVYANNDTWIPEGNATDNYVGYKFETKTHIYRVDVKANLYAPQGGSTVPAMNYAIQGSDDAGDWSSPSDLGTFSTPSAPASGSPGTDTGLITTLVNGSNNAYRIFTHPRLSGSGIEIQLRTIQFYGREEV